MPRGWPRKNGRRRRRRGVWAGTGVAGFLLELRSYRRRRSLIWFESSLTEVNPRLVPTVGRKRFSLKTPAPQKLMSISPAHHKLVWEKKNSDTGDQQIYLPCDWIAVISSYTISSSTRRRWVPRRREVVGEVAFPRPANFLSAFSLVGLGRLQSVGFVPKPSAWVQPPNEPHVSCLVFVFHDQRSW